jgi:hypothetical protein
MIVAVLSDTHAPSRCRSLPAGVVQRLAGADLILHAGDVCTTSLLEELAVFAPVHVAIGNCDPPEIGAWGGEYNVELDLEGVRVVVTHDAGPKERRAARMRRRFPHADIVVFGHSHMPVLSWEEGLMLLNPGSATDRRRAPHHTMALLRIEDGRPRAHIVQLD